MTRPNDSILRTLLPLVIALAGGIALNLSWAPHPFTALAFIALVPFLWVADRNRKNIVKVFALTFSGWFLFLASAGWWMYSSTVAGSLMAHVLNATLPAMVFSLWAWLPAKPTSSTASKALFFVSLWIAMEWFNSRWDFAWPWFRLGHVFGQRPQWVQWYRYTTSTGGTLWVLVVNYLFFTSIARLPAFRWHFFAGGLSAIALLLSFSLALPKLEYDAENVRVAIVQPNIHPQIEKFGGMDARTQYKKAIQLLDDIKPGVADYAVFPETLIIEPLEETGIDTSEFVELMRLCMENNNLQGVFSGAFTKRTKSWDPSDRESVIDGDEPMVLFNSLLFITADTVQIYHKQKLVPLVEKQPLLFIFKPIREFIERSGGFFGRYGTYNDQVHFPLDGMEATLTPLICFESAFSCHPEYTSTKGALVLVTNDGWWKTSGGYVQHLNLARLRAIERGQAIARAANTGVSCLIDPQGAIISSLPYGSEGVLLGELQLRKSSKISCIAKDLILLMCFLFLFVVLLSATLSLLKLRKKQLI